MPSEGESAYESYQLQQPTTGWSQQFNTGGANQPQQPQQLSMEQYEWLWKRLSSEDQAEFLGASKQCLYKVALTRSVPFAALVTGSLYYAGSRLPGALRIGPKSWMYYAAVGFASFTVSNVFFAGTCSNDMRLKLNELYHRVRLDACRLIVRVIGRRVSVRGSEPKDRCLVRRSPPGPPQRQSQPTPIGGLQPGWGPSAWLRGSKSVAVGIHLGITGSGTQDR